MSDSDSTNFSGTITGGIQDISALLPLLGTEQCEKHIGSALDRGYLYSSVTPVSIFGSLGIVRATFNILIASLSFEKLGFLGASKLRDGGFSPNGDVAPMIAFGSKHSKRFIAEVRLEAMLTEEHIDNVEDLTVSWGEGIVWWNILLFVSTLIMATAGLLPYVLLILNSGASTSTKLFPLGFGFPILRVVGSGLCVILTQFLIQIRILVLLKTRLLFITIDRLAKMESIDIGQEMNTPLAHTRGSNAWNSELASERCIWALRRYLSSSPMANDPERSSAHSFVKSIYTEQSKRQLESIETRFLRWINPLLVFCLILGCCSTIVGYIGCFYLIQRSVKSNGPLLWLVLEALLSIVRIFVWAINPSWDDSHGVAFELQLASLPPLVTCNKSESDFRHDGTAPLMRSDRFLEEVRVYTGQYSAFSATDVALYYILMAKGESASENPNGLLYIVLSDHKEQTSRLLFKEPNESTFSIYVSSLEPVARSTVINVKVDFSKEDGKTELDSHYLTSDTTFMARLDAHYSDITRKIQIQVNNRKRNASFGRTWGLQRPTKDRKDDLIVSVPGDVYPDNKRRVVVEEQYENSPLTAENMAYLRQGQIERRWRDLYRQLEEWVGLFVVLYTKELLQSIAPNLILMNGDTVSIVQKYEANEVEFLLVECQRVLELLLASTAGKWDLYVKKNHAKMVSSILKGTFEHTNGQGHGSGITRKQQSEEIRKNKMMRRLANEIQELLNNDARKRRDNMRDRVAAQRELTNQRIQSRKYVDNTGEAIAKTWEDMSKDVDLLNPPLDDGVRASIAKWRKDSKAALDARHQKALDDASNFTGDARTEQCVEVDKLYARCQQRADLLFLTLEAQRAEFEDLHSPDVLTEDKHELVKYWSSPSLHERRRLLSRPHRYLHLDNKAIETVGGRENMLRALQRSQNFVYMDLQAADLLEAKDITAIINSVKSVTGITAPRRYSDIVKYYEMIRQLVERIERISSDIKHATGELEGEHTTDGDEDVFPFYRRLFDVDGHSDREAEPAAEEEHTSDHDDSENTADDDADITDENEDIIDLAIMTRRREMLQSDDDVYFCADVDVTEFHRPGEPYLVFSEPGKSRCFIHFFTKKKADHIVTVRHRFTNEDGHDAEVVIKLNGQDMTESWQRARGGNVQRQWDTNEDIHLPVDHLEEIGQRNVLEIILKDNSEVVYWLSDVFLPVEAIAEKAAT